MRFWDTSALVPLVVKEGASPEIEPLLSRDPVLVIGWHTTVEFEGALARRSRAGTLSEPDLDRARGDLAALLTGAIEIEPSSEVRSRAIDLLYLHDLRAADALQLACAILWAEEPTVATELVSLDARLRQAARSEGFAVLPDDASIKSALLQEV